ncbi:hypothetical protein SLW70_04750 [Flavobacterium sp. NG2]|uniref:hypothetical protein n=1 Tax=Flavobacterium sp. NG2 TaxID=3097547 RepID=UPI002A7F31F4|nr:hypothetical protein [Flavobacterium sp. NG2]WPR72453.1 hypothetical protein SLW70_04750 [Flavobacterium sp. NG2]
MNSKDNFHLLLSELDEEGVIKYGILPFLKDYLKKVELKTINTNKIIDNFINLRSVYESFYSIIRTDDLIKKSEYFSEQFRKYNPRIEDEKNADKESEKLSEFARAKLAKEDIQPFIISYKENIKHKIIELENHLDEQNQSDTDIISLI